MSIAPPETKECPFCAETVKFAAGRCRYCGADLGSPNAPTTGSASSGIQVIEQTSKSHKTHMLLSTLVLAIGLFLFFAGLLTQSPGVMVAGTVPMLVGLVWHFVARFRAWWHHG